MPVPDFDFDAGLKRHAEIREKMEPKIKEVRETRRLNCRCQIPSSQFALVSFSILWCICCLDNLTRKP